MNRAVAIASLCTLAGCVHTQPVLHASGKAQGTSATTSLPREARAATLQFPAYDGKSLTVRFALKEENQGLRTFVQSSNAPMRDGAPSMVTFVEVKGQPALRSGSLAFDALFAHAVAELRQNSVSAISDPAYQGGVPIACECFETGEKWHYVWTRDVSYAAALGLVLVDPQRVRTSLEFKLAEFRPGLERALGVAGSVDGLQIVQDTGSGGSWPVSSDRVSWAFGAEAALDALPFAERAAFEPEALQALSNTIENDRLAAFDPRDGLYTGEQSFLDWREQSYGSDIGQDLARMASAKALSTNVAHYKALQVAAALAVRQGKPALASRYRGWATELRAAINRRFWLDDAQMYGSLTAPHFDGAALHKFDWLGLALAIVTGVADQDRAQRILAAYPHGPMGAPVIWPQQQGVPVYHNRSIWPFVTAYGLDAAAGAGNVSVADAAYATLLRGASVHLSNMENMEWLSGASIWAGPEHRALNGPVINSHRQLWSVGAYIGMVVRNVFGIHVRDGGIDVRPFVTARLRRDWLSGSDAMRLQNLSLAGHRFTVMLVLPPVPAEGEEGVYGVAEVRLNGRAAGASIRWDELAEDNVLEVRLGALQPGVQRIRRVDGLPGQIDGPLFAPFEPEIAAVRRDAGGMVQVTLRDTRNAAGTVRYRLYRNGSVVAGDLRALQWSGPVTASGGNCFSVQAVSIDSGNGSHHSAPLCAESGADIGAGDKRVASNVQATADSAGVLRLQDWGGQQDRFVVRAVAIARSGRYAIQLRYLNHNNDVKTGNTNGVKLLTVRNAAGQVVAQRVVQMPHLPKGSAPRYSTPADVQLEAGSYTVELGDFYNMSYLTSNALYGASGGASGPVNRMDIYGLLVLHLE